MKTVLITGGTGLVGQRLSELLEANDYKVRHLSRTENLDARFPAYAWDIESGEVDERALEGVDYLIHLAGAGIADKSWTDERKKVIVDSRVKSLELLEEKYKERPFEERPKALISASAIGYYGDAGEQPLDETSSAGFDFLSETAIAWEQAAQNFTRINIRTAIVRIGIVLSTKGGALEKMLPSYSMGVGAYFGDGEQYYSWIHIDDLCRIFMHLLEFEAAEGPYNGTAPSPVPNKEFAKAIAKAKEQYALMVPAPTFAMRLFMGERANVVLEGTRAIPLRLRETDFEFEFPNLIPALKDLFKHKK